MKLVEMAQLTRKAVVILAVLIVVYFIGWALKQPTKDLFLALFPPKNLPTLTFGNLPPLEFTQVQILNTNPEYVLNTRTGKLPAELPKVLPVYQVISPSLSFGAGERAQRDAARLGFTDAMRTSTLSSAIFEWQDVSFGGGLTINTQTNTLELDTPLGGKGSLFPAGKISRLTAIEVATDLLTDIGRFSDNLYSSGLDGFQEVTFGKFSPSGVIQAESTLEAQVAMVDFFRQINNFPILGPHPAEGMLRVVLREPASAEQFPQLSFPKMHAYHWSINQNPSATYPLIPVSLAWEKVSQNQGVIASVVPNGATPFEDFPPVRVDRILINDVYIAYFDNTTPQRYLQPIYVFEGNFTAQTGGAGDITIYYPAISGENVNQPTSN